MNQNVTVIHDKVTLKFSGNFDIASALTLRETLAGYLDQGHKSFVIDLAEARFIDGAGLGGLVGIRNQLAKKGGRCVIRGRKGIVKDLFELTRNT